MTGVEKSLEGLAAENARLTQRLEEAEETLQAIRGGDVDALVVARNDGHRVYTLEGADRPYRLLVEQMQQGAATLLENGTVVYCNRRAAGLLGADLEAVVGARLLDFVAPESHDTLVALLKDAANGVASGELVLAGDAQRTSVLATMNPLPPDCGATIGVLLTDLTLQKHHERLAGLHAALRRTEATLRRQANQLAVFLETAAIGLRRIGPDGTILWANDAELRMFGYTATEYVGRPFAAFHVDRDAAAEFLAQLREGRLVRDHVARIRCRDGSIKQVLIDSSVLRDDGQFVHTQCFTRDVTERLRAEERLRASEASLREADERKNQFLAMLSHELRNPLAPILHATHLLRIHAKADESDVQARARAIIERQTESIAKLVNELLDIARLTTGRIQLRRRTIDLRDSVRHALETVHPVIERSGHVVRTALPAHETWIDGDPTRIEEVIVNILGNAAKYTPDGGRIHVAVEDDGTTARVRVADNGVGIGANELPHVFELFTQADRSLDRSQGGLGIGLHLVQRLVELHGGTVAARSAGSGMGSEFTVSLPRVGAPVPKVVADDTEPAPERAGNRVLVVDDNLDSCAALGLFLSLQGYRVETVHTGPHAIEMAHAWRPTLVLLDIGLPGLSGYEVARRLRSEFPAEVMRLVAITGYGRDEDVARAKESGFDAHLLKPIDPTIVDRLVAKWGLTSGGAGAAAEP